MIAVPRTSSGMDRKSFQVVHPGFYELAKQPETRFCKVIGMHTYSDSISHPARVDPSYSKLIPTGLFMQY